ncbi:hypothetical protein Hanom_Chr10g00903361 [Helianthus anomalus]
MSTILNDLSSLAKSLSLSLDSLLILVKLDNKFVPSANYLFSPSVVFFFSSWRFCSFACLGIIGFSTNFHVTVS